MISFTNFAIQTNWFATSFFWQKMSLPHLSGQIIATSHDLTLKGSWGKEFPLFQKNPGWWNIIIWPDHFLLKKTPIIHGGFWCLHIFVARHTWGSSPEVGDPKNWGPLGPLWLGHESRFITHKTHRCFFLALVWDRNWDLFFSNWCWDFYLIEWSSIPL